MGLITRCPACGTMFKVVADQLKISEGWVRCGHCAEIFDATADLRDESEIDVAAVAHADQHGDQEDREESGAPAGSSQRDSEPESITSSYPSVQSQVDDSAIEDMPEPDAMEIDEQVQALHEHPLDQPFELRRADTSDVEEAGPYGFSKPMPLEPEPELHDLSFVRKARRREFWGRPVVRAGMFLLLLLLAALLAAQVAYRDRDHLAAAEPQLRPWFERVCAFTGCRIGPPHSIDSVAIETSSFNKVRGDTYRLNVTLRNQGPTPVAMPALELTLTDSQDQPVVRRVVQAPEFAPGTPAIGGASDWSASVVIALDAQAAGGRVSGYRVLAFYP